VTQTGGDELNPRTGKPYSQGQWSLTTVSSQEEMSNAAKLWSQQAEERRKGASLTSFERLQQELYAAGMYGSTSYNDVKVGQWDTTTQTAMKTALEHYEDFIQGAQEPMTFNEFLKQQASTDADGGFFSQKGKGIGSAGTGSSSVPQVNLTDPAAIRSAAQAAAQQALGQGLSEDQLNAFVQQFQAAQQSDQSSLNPTTTTPDLSSQALAFAEQQSPGEYKDHQIQGYMNTLLNMFLPSESQRANVQPVASVGGADV